MIAVLRVNWRHMHEEPVTENEQPLSCPPATQDALPPPTEGGIPFPD